MDKEKETRRKFKTRAAQAERKARRVAAAAQKELEGL